MAEIDDHQQRMFIWSIVDVSRVICSYFFDGTVNGVSLLEILRNVIIPELTVSGIM